MLFGATVDSSLSPCVKIKSSDYLRKGLTTNSEQREVADHGHQANFFSFLLFQHLDHVLGLFLHDQREVLQDVEVEGRSEDLAALVPISA